MTTRLFGSLLVAGAAAAPALGGTLQVNWNHQFLTPTTVRVWAEVDVIDVPSQFAGLAGTLFDVVGVDPGLTRSIDFDENASLGRRFQMPGASPGVLAGASILGVDAAQAPSAFNPQFVAGPTVLDFFVFEYTFTDLTPRVVSFASDHQYFRVYAGQSAAWGQNEDIEVVVSGTTIDFDGGMAVIPLPPAAGLAAGGLGFTCAARRRRGPFTCV